MTIRIIVEHHIKFLNSLKIEHSGGGSLSTQIAKLERTVMKVSEATAAFIEVKDALVEASDELLALIEKLKESDPDISPEGAAAVEKSLSIARALKDVVRTPEEGTAPTITSAVSKE